MGGRGADRGRNQRATGEGDPLRGAQECGAFEHNAGRHRLYVAGGSRGRCGADDWRGKRGQSARPTGHAARSEDLRFRMRIRDSVAATLKELGVGAAPRRVADGKDVTGDWWKHGRTPFAAVRNDSGSDASAGERKHPTSFLGRRDKRLDRAMASCRGWCFISLRVPGMRVEGQCGLRGCFRRPWRHGHLLREAGFGRDGRIDRRARKRGRRAANERRSVRHADRDARSRSGAVSRGNRQDREVCEATRSGSITGIHRSRRMT